MRCKCALIPVFMMLLQAHVLSQAKGNLFIIGGGHKSKELMQSLINTAQLTPRDYIAFLPMATGEPDTSFYYIEQDFKSVCSNVVVSFNFTKNDSNKTAWLDSVKNAKLIFIAGGDQSRFMNIVLHTPVQQAIKEAYKNGATIAGTSAGAALMSYYMITGNQLLDDTTYAATFPKLLADNIEIKEGLGLLDSAIIDMHFVVRSRYNRLFSALAKYPSLPCIGIDEGTAIIVHNNKANIAGNSEVIVFKHPQHLIITKDKQIKFTDVELSIFTAGDSFFLK